MQKVGKIGWVVQERKLKMFKIYMTDELHTLNDGKQKQKAMDHQSDSSDLQI